LAERRPTSADHGSSSFGGAVDRYSGCLLEGGDGPTSWANHSAVSELIARCPHQAPLRRTRCRGPSVLRATRSGWTLAGAGRVNGTDTELPLRGSCSCNLMSHAVQAIHQLANKNLLAACEGLTSPGSNVVDVSIRRFAAAAGPARTHLEVACRLLFRQSTNRPWSARGPLAGIT